MAREQPTRGGVTSTRDGVLGGVSLLELSVNMGGVVSTPFMEHISNCQSRGATTPHGAAVTPGGIIGTRFKTTGAYTGQRGCVALGTVDTCGEIDGWLKHTPNACWNNDGLLGNVANTIEQQRLVEHGVTHKRLSMVGPTPIRGLTVIRGRAPFDTVTGP